MNHSFDVDIAVKHGVHAAILYETIRFWVLKNKANDKHFHDGRYWTYNSAKAFCELFPYLSPDQIQRNLKSLERVEMVVVGCYNSSPYDRTRWYSTADGCLLDSADLRNVDSAKARNEIPQDCGTYTSSNTVQTQFKQGGVRAQAPAAPAFPKLDDFDAEQAEARRQAQAAQLVAEQKAAAAALEATQEAAKALAQARAPAKTEKPAKAAVARAVEFPANFEPNDGCIALATQLGVTLDGVDGELARFEDYHVANGTKFKDWQAGLRTWIRNAAKFAKRDQVMVANKAASRRTPANEDFDTKDYGVRRKL